MPLTAPTPIPALRAPRTPSGSATAYMKPSGAARTISMPATTAVVLVPSTGSSTRAERAVQMAPATRVTVHFPVRAASALQAMNTAEPIERISPMVAVERPASLSWAGATRNTTPSEKPPSSIRVTAPAISGLRRARPSAALSRSGGARPPCLPSPAGAGGRQQQAGREGDAAMAEPVAGDSAGDGTGDDRQARRRKGDSRFEPGHGEGVTVGRQQRHQRHQHHLVHEDQGVEQDQEPSHRPSLWVVSSDDAASPDPRVQPRAPGAGRGGAAPAGRGGGAAGHLGCLDRRLRGGAPGVDRAAARGRAGALAGPAARRRRLAERGATAGSRGRPGGLVPAAGAGNADRDGRTRGGPARGRRLVADPGRRSALTLGLMLDARHALLLVAAGDGAGLGRRLRGRPRAVPPSPDEPFASLL